MPDYRSQAGYFGGVGLLVAGVGLAGRRAVVFDVTLHLTALRSALLVAHLVGVLRVPGTLDPGEWAPKPRVRATVRAFVARA